MKVQQVKYALILLSLLLFTGCTRELDRSLLPKHNSETWGQQEERNGSNEN